MLHDQKTLDKARAILAHLAIKETELPKILIDDDSEEPTIRTEEELLEAHYKEDSLFNIKTVRFLKDFISYNAGYDLNTTNESFLKIATIYKKMGVKNYYFMLQINNPLLIGVDPHSPDLTEEQKLMIHHECRQNFWYYIREVLIVGGGNRFKASRANISFLWCWLCHVNTMLIIPRQFGKTVSAQAIMFWLEYFSGRGYESHLITLKDDNRSQFIEAIKTIRNSIPAWLTNVTYRDKDAGNSLSYSAFGDSKKNILRISVPQIGVEAARNVGRGLTVKTRIIDEPAYIKHMEAILNGAGPSTLTARANARNDGEAYGTGFITTPASTLTESGKYMYDMLMASTEWREPYFDAFNESHLYDILIANASHKTSSPTVGIVFNYLQLGKNKDWIKKTIDELKLSLSEAKIDLLLMWDDAGKDKLFDDLTRDTLNNSKAGRQFSQKISDTNLYFDWFITQEQHAKILLGESNTHYGIGVDTSSAINKDACTVIIRDLADGKLVGAGRYPLANLMDVGKLCETLLLEISNSTLIIERNYAHHMIDQLLRSLPALGIDPFKRMFNQIFQDPVRYAKEYQDIKNRSFGNRNDAFYLNYKQHFGFITSSRTRNELYGFLQEAVGSTGDKIFYGKLIDEICELKERNGRIDHDRDGHDDLVIAWMLTFWFMKLGESKTEYGIPPGVVMSRMTLMRMSQSADEPIDEVKMARHRLYQEKITELSESLMKANDPAVIQRLELIIDKLQQSLPAESRKAFNIDDIKRNAKELRDKRMVEQRRKLNRWSY